MWLDVILDSPLRSGIAAAVLGLPLAFLASRISPLPQTIDIPLMEALLWALGGMLSRTLPGTLPARQALYDRLAEEQEKLEALP